MDRRRKPVVRVGCSTALQGEGGKGLAGDGAAADRDSSTLFGFLNSNISSLSFHSFWVSEL